MSPETLLLCSNRYCQLRYQIISECIPSIFTPRKVCKTPLKSLLLKLKQLSDTCMDLYYTSPSALGALEGFPWRKGVGCEECAGDEDTLQVCSEVDPPFVQMSLMATQHVVMRIVLVPFGDTTLGTTDTLAKKEKAVCVALC
ncbi:uncharacterized protein FYW23_001411 [Sylvia borin]